MAGSDTKRAEKEYLARTADRAGRFRIAMKLTRLFSRLPRAFWWSLLVYTALTAWQGRDALAGLHTDVVHDIGDPLLTAAIMAWNAQNVPFTQAWWDLPIFAPTRNALAFSEHLLGLAPISTPIYWLTGSALVTHNLTTLLTFPLCGAAAFLLVWRLTGSGPASFLAGLAFAFTPYRMAHLSHIHVLAAFWMPLALLGLHDYLETGRVPALMLFAAAWVFQGASNGYFLIYFSVLVGLWVVWFVLLGRRWGVLWRVAIAGAVAAVPLVPILYRYFTVHSWYGFARNPAEVVYYSADVAAVLCAPYLVELWNWLQVSCKPEGQLFPGITVPLVCVLAVVFLARSNISVPRQRLVRTAVLVAIAVGVAYVAIAASVWWGGRWRLELGPLTATASSFKKPFSNALWAFAIALVLTAWLGRVGGSRASWFYAFGALATWMLALGPIPMLGSTPALDTAPYSWLMLLPGVDSLRVPARFWTLTVLCAATLMGLLVSGVLARAGRRAAVAITALITCGLASDGWIHAIPVVPAPGMQWAERLANSVVLELPFEHVDATPGLRAIQGGWRTANGYSGYHPPSYSVLRAAARADDGSFLPYVRSSGLLNVLVRKDAPRQVEMIERELGLRAAAESNGQLLYIVQQRTPVVRLGRRIGVSNIAASCGTDLMHQAIDGVRSTVWNCGHQFADEYLLLDLGEPLTVAAIRHTVGERASDHPRSLVVDTSEDLRVWTSAWAGGPAGLVFQAAVTEPRNPSFVVPFSARRARYVRLRQVGRDPETHWSVAEVEVYEPVAEDQR